MEKLKESMDKGDESGALLIDLSKVFGYINHKLLMGKLFWYGDSPLSLYLISSFKSN